MKKTRVLIFPSGAENAINIYDSLKYNLHFELFGATIKNDHSNYIFDKNHLSIGNYKINDEKFIDNFNELLKKFEIDYIFPTHDEISEFLMLNQSKINATIICSPYETTKISLSKIDTFNKLKGKNYIPKIYNLNDNIIFPVFIKPDIGAGGKGTHLVNTKEELIKYCSNEKYLISEYLPGDELTVDCFTNKNGKLLFIGPRTRERITTGVSFKSKNVKLTKEIKNIANDLNKTFKFRGLWFFQLKSDLNNKYKLMEICIRSAGTMALYRQLGINFAALSLFDFMGYDVSITMNKYNIELDRYYKSCYKIDLKYKNIYIDFDDTMIVNGLVNSDVIKFIYQCLNNNKNIYLLTKHEEDIHLDLKKYKISEEIFKEIIHIDPSLSKADYINERDAIFIDNYYPDRKIVFEIKNIPVFDVDAIESLIKYDQV